MALQFTETAPGVHTATWTNPKNQQRQNIAVIESCDAFQLFIDGELSVRDLPSFKAAVAQAESNFKSGSSSRMVRAAGFLVLVSVVGATAIGAAKLLSADLTADAASAPKAAAAPPVRKFARVKPKGSATRIESQARSPKPPVAQVVTTVASVKPPVEAPAEPVTRRFSANHSVLGINAITKSKTADKPAAKTLPRAVALTTTAKLKPISEVVAPVIINTTPKAPAVPALSRAAKTHPIDPKPETEAEPVSTATIDDAGGDVPPVPSRAPVQSNPVRFATAPLERAILGLRELQNEEEDVYERAPKAKSKKAHKPRRLKTRTRRTETSKRSSRRVKRAARPRLARSQPVRRRIERRADVRPAPRPRRLSCFAHVCRWQ